jgi:hypothetical protein
MVRGKIEEIKKHERKREKEQKIKKAYERE